MLVGWLLTPKRQKTITIAKQPRSLNLDGYSAAAHGTWKAMMALLLMRRCDSFGPMRTGVEICTC